MRRFQTFIFALALALISGCGGTPANVPSAEKIEPVAGQENNAATAALVDVDTTSAETDTFNLEEIEFGYTSSEGNEILTIKTEGLKDPAKFSMAIAENGSQFAIQFVAQKEATASNNGRQNEYNFKDIGGFLYKVKAGKVSAEQSLMLVSADFLAKHKPLKFNPSASNSLSKAIRTKIEGEKGRKIKKSNLLRKLEGGQEIWLFVFQQKADSALASLAVVSEGKVIYQDFPALYNEISTWRVDDGGEFGLDDIHILAAFDYEGKIEIVTDWAGAEGFSIHFLQEDGKVFRSLKNDGRYCAPF
jgi:hypothetical protein